MPIRQGYVTASSVGGRITLAITDDLNTYAFVPWNPAGYDVGKTQQMGGGKSLNVRPVSSLSRKRVGSRTSSYLDDFYYRIHYIPRSIRFGNILSNQETTLGIWNAYFDSKILNTLSIPPQTGVALVPPTGVTLPLSMNPLREVVYTVQASLVGPPVLNDYIVSDVSGAAYSVPVTGARLLVFPYKPNWSSAYDETFVYNSWFLNAADGSEQSGSNWGNQPRREFDYTILVTHNQMQRLENLLFGWQHRLFGVPHWVDTSKLTAATTVGGTAVAADTTDRSFEAGGFAMFYEDPDNFEAFEILSLSASTLVATSPFARAWPIGTRLYPVSSALIAGSLRGAYHTDSLLVMPVSFSCEPSNSPVNNPVGGATPMYRNEELYLGKLNWASPLSFQQESDRDVIDFKTGNFKTYSQQGFSKTTRKHNWQMSTRAQSRDFRAWLGRREGVARPVYMPTGNSDFTLATTIPAATLVLEVFTSEYAGLVAMASSRRDILILLRDGTYFARRITGTETLANGRTRLTVDTAISQNIDPAQVKRISFLILYRQDSNSTTIRWLNDSVGVAEANLKTKTTV